MSNVFSTVTDISSSPALITTGTSYIQSVACRKRLLTTSDATFNCANQTSSSTVNGVILLSSTSAASFTFRNPTPCTQYEMICVDSATNTTFTMPNGVLLYGSVLIMKSDNSVTGFRAANSGSFDFTMNGTTKGGAAGSYLLLTFTSTTTALISGVLYGVGVLDNPFGENGP